MKPVHSEPHQYNIITSSNSGLVLQIAISLTVISENLKHDFIDFYLLHSEINQKHINMLFSLCATFSNITLHEVKVSNPEAYDRFVQSGGWVREAYYSLCAHQLLPDTMNRALYLDAGDVLILGDIAPYYTCDFEDNFLIATAQKYKRENDIPVPYEADDLEKGEPHLSCILDGLFNSGCYMINLEKMRKENITLSYYAALTDRLKTIKNVKEGGLLYFGDQGLLSAAFAGRIKYYGYPQMRESWYAPYNFGLGYYEHYDQKPDWQPKIIHFAGVPFKPWHANYPVFPERLRMNDLSKLKPLQLEYYYLWLEYFLRTIKVLSI